VSIFSDKSIVLFEFLIVGEKRSKQIKIPHHYQGQAIGTRKKFYHICCHRQSPTMGFLPSCTHLSLKHCPEATS
jgi:hypothetical protein